ncbi:hypothetical protein JOM56_015385 [Amanita muscaria]
MEQDDKRVQLHFDVAQPPDHMETEDQPDQQITLTAALSAAAAAATESHAERFHAQAKHSQRLEYFAAMYEKDDNRSAIQSLLQHHEVTITDSNLIVNALNDQLAWHLVSHYLNLQICVGAGLGLAAMLPNITMHHTMEFWLDLKQQAWRFGAKYAKLGFDPTGCMLWIGRSSTGEDTWLAWVRNESLWDEAEDIPPASGKEGTVMSKKHYRMVVMFLAEMLTKINHQDVIVTNPYPDIEDDTEFQFATNALASMWKTIHEQADWPKTGQSRTSWTLTTFLRIRVENHPRASGLAKKWSKSNELDFDQFLENPCRELYTRKQIGQKVVILVVINDLLFCICSAPEDSNRRTNLNLNALQRLDDTIRDEYQNWVDEAPLFYLEDDFLTSRVPVAITSRFGQNQQLAESRADRDQEVLNWAQDRDYKRIRYLTIALASHLRVRTVHSWRERLIADIRENFSAGIYNSRNDDTREIITWDELAEMPLVDDEGREIPIYCGMGFNIPRRIPRFSKHSLPHGVLVDLRKVKDLFQHELDEEDFYMDEDTAPVDVYTYPQAGTKIAGHFQANGLMLNVGVFVKLVNESLTYVPDAMDEDEEDALPRRPKNIVNGIACQGYNAVMHSTRGDSAQHHDAQLGMITGALSGCWVTNPAGTRTARYLREKCARLLPHEAFSTKIKNERILRDLRLENVFWIDIKAMDKDDQDGTRILTKIIRPLTYSWNHPVLMDKLKPQAYPMIYNWTTYPLTTLLAKIWKQGYDAWMQHRHPDTLQVELCSALERALNFMHTGNVAVIATSAMNPLWIGLSIIHDGLPCLNEAILPTVANKILIDKAQWPLNSRNMPVSASRCAQIRTYSLGHYNFSWHYSLQIFYAHLAMSTLSSHHLPVTLQEQNPNINTANDCKDLVPRTNEGGGFLVNETLMFNSEQIVLSILFNDEVGVQNIWLSIIFNDAVGVQYLAWYHTAGAGTELIYYSSIFYKNAKKAIVYEANKAGIDSQWRVLPWKMRQRLGCYDQWMDTNK